MLLLIVNRLRGPIIFGYLCWKKHHRMSVIRVQRGRVVPVYEYSMGFIHSLNICKVFGFCIYSIDFSMGAHNYHILAVCSNSQVYPQYCNI